MNSNDRNIVNRNKIQELVNQIDPRHSLDSEVEELLLEVVDEFMDSVTSFACALAKHRGSDSLQVKDLQMHLQSHWGMKVPGYWYDTSSTNGRGSEHGMNGDSGDGDGGVGGDSSSTTGATTTVTMLDRRMMTDVHKERIKMVRSSETKWQKAAKKQQQQQLQQQQQQQS